MSEQETLELKRLLVKHYSKLLKQKVTKVISERGYTQNYWCNVLYSGTIIMMPLRKHKSFLEQSSLLNTYLKETDQEKAQ